MTIVTAHRRRALITCIWNLLEASETTGLFFSSSEAFDKLENIPQAELSVVVKMMLVFEQTTS